MATMMSACTRTRLCCILAAVMLLAIMIARTSNKTQVVRTSNLMTDIAAAAAAAGRRGRRGIDSHSHSYSKPHSKPQQPTGRIMRGVEQTTTTTTMTTTTTTTTMADSRMGKHRRERMDVYLAERAKCEWVSIDMEKENMMHEYKWSREEHSRPFLRPMGLSVCEVTTTTSKDEGGEEEEEGWIFTRVGPFVGTGGYDWHSGGVHPVPRSDRAKFITANMFAPIAEDGRILSYPPVHTHHCHNEMDGVQHWFDSHGDSICSEEYGGTACYLREEPEGYGLPLLESDLYTLDFSLNDVREENSPAMTFYLETSLRWSSNPNLKPVSRALLRPQKITEHPYFTILLPTRERSIIWNTGKWLVDGQVLYSLKDQLPWFHSHRSFTQGLWAFAASPEDLGLTVDLLEQTPQASLPQESGQNSTEKDACWIPPPEQDAVQVLMDTIKSSSAGMGALKCWLVPGDSADDRTLEFVRGTDTSPGEYPEAWQQNWKESWYDRVGTVYCDGSWTFKKGEPYTIVAVNGLDEKLSDKTSLPNLQHIGLKMDYETFGEQRGPNMEIYGSYGDEFVANGHHLGAMYKLPVTYLSVLNRVEELAEFGSDTNAFANWYYNYTQEDPEYRKYLVSTLEELSRFTLQDEFNISHAIVHAHDHNDFSSFRK